MKRYKKPMVAVVVTPESLMDNDKVNIGIASNPSSETGSVGAKSYNGTIDWEDDGTSGDEGTSQKSSSWN